MTEPAEKRPGVMDDVVTTSHGEDDELGRVMDEIDRKLREIGYELVGIVAKHPDGLAVLRARGVPIAFSEAVLQGLSDRALMRVVSRGS